MKKTILALSMLTALSASTVFAAPINTLGTEETAIGFGTNESYIEHKIGDNFTLGYQYSDRDQYGDMNDIYGQIDLTSNVRGIVGHRGDLPGDESNFYGGIALNAPLFDATEGYASYITGADFHETQVGLNVGLASNLDLNINYHNFEPDYGRSENGVGIGATLKF